MDQRVCLLLVIIGIIELPIVKKETLKVLVKVKYSIRKINLLYRTRQIKKMSIMIKV